MVQAKREATQVKFTETKTGLFISKTEANHLDSMSILVTNGLRPLTYQEALSRAPELIMELKGNWFWLAGEGMAKDGVYTFDNKGELQLLEGNEKYDHKVRVCPGTNPLFLFIHDGHGDEWGFDLFAYDRPSDVASVVVGLKSSSQKDVEPSQKTTANILQSKLRDH